MGSWRMSSAIDDLSYVHFDLWSELCGDLCEMHIVVRVVAIYT
jgi:hypothetical protein